MAHKNNNSINDELNNTVQNNSPFFFFASLLKLKVEDARDKIYSSHLRITYWTDEKSVCTFCFLLFSLAQHHTEWMYYIDVGERAHLDRGF